MEKLIIFIKNPQIGKVKTRLAATIGDEAALTIYKKLLQHTQKIALEAAKPTALYYSNFIDNDDDWNPNFFEKKQQIGDDLGNRMSNAFEDAHKNAQKVVIIGSDCPALTADIINDAFVALQKYDFVIGPANDGGYYLLGMSAYSPSVFDDIEWSTSSVGEKTIKAIEDLQKSYFLLPSLSDLDNEEDLKEMNNFYEII